jgi:hypothetical protein
MLFGTGTNPPGGLFFFDGKGEPTHLSAIVLAEKGGISPSEECKSLDGII